MAIQVNAVAGRAHNLPARPDGVVDRDGGVAAVADLLAASRLVTIVGPAGVGQSLAAATAQRLAAGCPDGAWFVSLAGLLDDEEVIGAVRAALAMADEPGRPSPRPLAWALRDRRLLLVLHGCDPVRAAAGDLAGALVRGCPQATVLATGEQALAIPGEQVWHLSPSAVRAPDPVTQVQARVQAPVEAPAPARASSAAWCVELAERAAPELAAGDQRGWLARVDAEQDNLRAALTAAAEDPEGGDQLVRLAGALALYWTMRGRFHTGRRWLEAAVAADVGSPRQRATARWGAALMARALGNFSRATAHAGEALSLADDLGDPQLRARALSVLGVVGVTTREQPETAMGQLADSVAAARQAGDAWSEVAALTGLGLGHLLAGEPEAARVPFDQCLARAEQPRNRAAEAHRLHPLVGLARVELAAGAHRTAERHVRDALLLARDLGVPAAAANALRYLARAVRLDTEQSTIAAAPDVDDLAALGRLMLGKGDTAQARRVLTEALGLARTEGLRAGAAGVLADLAAVERLAGDAGAARARADEALTAARSAGDGVAAAHATHELGRLARAGGDHRKAAGRHHEALVTARAAGDGPLVADCLEALAGLAALRGAPHAAARLFGAAGVLRDTGMPRAPAEQPGYAADVAVLRLALDPDDVAATWAQGVGRTLDAIIADAAPA